MKAYFLTLLTSALLWLAPAVAQAQAATGATQINLKPLSPFPDNTSIRSLILHDIPNFLIAFIGVVFMVFFLINAFRYLIGSGNTESTGAAKSGMLSAIIGIVVVVTAYGIVVVANRWITQ